MTLEAMEERARCLQIARMQQELYSNVKFESLAVSAAAHAAAHVAELIAEAILNGADEPGSALAIAAKKLNEEARS